MTWMMKGGIIFGNLHSFAQSQGQEDLGKDRPGVYAVLRRAAVVPTARHCLIVGPKSGDFMRKNNGILLM